jgi:hypothetical protein
MFYDVLELSKFKSMFVVLNLNQNVEFEMSILKCSNSFSCPKMHHVVWQPCPILQHLVNGNCFGVPYNFSVHLFLVPYFILSIRNVLNGEIREYLASYH